jgi:hypothetical protein
VDAACFSPGYYVWGMLKAWEVQSHYMANHFQDDPALTRIFTCQILFHGQDLSLKGAIEDLTMLSSWMPRFILQLVRAKQWPSSQGPRDWHQRLKDKQWLHVASLAPSQAPITSDFGEEVAGFLGGLHVYLHMKRLSSVKMAGVGL